MDYGNRIQPITVTTEDIDQAPTEAEKVQLLEKLISEEAANTAHNYQYFAIRHSLPGSKSAFFAQLYRYCCQDMPSRQLMEIFTYRGSDGELKGKLPVTIQVTGIAHHVAEKDRYKGINRQGCIDIEATITSVADYEGVYNPSYGVVKEFFPDKEIKIIYSLQREVGRIYITSDYYVPPCFAANDGFPVFHH